MTNLMDVQPAYSWCNKACVQFVQGLHLAWAAQNDIHRKLTYCWIKQYFGIHMNTLFKYGGGADTF